MSDERDNTNRGALWSCKGFCGKVDLSGESYFVHFVEVGSKSDTGPRYYAIVKRSGEQGNGQVIPVWKITKDGSKALANFKFSEHVVFVFLNTPKDGQQQASNAPILRLSAQVEQKPAPEAPVKESIDDLPF